MHVYISAIDFMYHIIFMNIIINVLSNKSNQVLCVLAIIWIIPVNFCWFLPAKENLQHIQLLHNIPAKENLQHIQLLRSITLYIMEELNHHSPSIAKHKE